jgi:hypothetical protein
VVEEELVDRSLAMIGGEEHGRNAEEGVLVAGRRM